jgi:hypothetical protein
VEDISSNNLIFENSIPDFNIHVKFYPEHVEVFDLHTNELLRKQMLGAQVFGKLLEGVEPYLDKKNAYKLISEGKELFYLKFDLLGEFFHLKTGAEYILNIGIFESEGFYAGLYEFGTFTFNHETIELKKKISTNKISYGVFDFTNKLFFVHRSSIGIECWNCTNNDLALRWKNTHTDIFKGLTLDNAQYLITGNVNGEIHVFDRFTGQKITQYRFFEGKIRHLLWTDQCVALFTKEKLIKFNLDGDIIWETNLPTDKLAQALTIIEDQIHVTYYEGIISIIDNNTGEIVKEYTNIKSEIFAPTSIMLGKWLVYTYPTTIRSFKLDDLNNISEYFLGDTVVRALHEITDGIIIGEDNGKIMLIKRPNIEIDVLPDVREL